MSTKTITPEFRVAFPAVFRAKRNDLSGKDEYAVVALFKKGQDLTKLHDAAEAALVKKFGENKKKWPVKWRSPFRDQGEREKVDDNGKKSLPQGYEKGAIYLNLKSNERPGLVDQNVEEIIDSANFYGGCWARATINAYAYDHKGNRGVAFGLMNLQKLRDDDSFGNRAKAQDDFSPVENVDSGDSGEEKATASDIWS